MVSLCTVITALTFFLMPAPTTLYDAQLSPIAELPAGYFVLQSDATAPDGYISVVYDDLSGFVRATEVSQVDYRPVTKYETTVCFRCDNDGQPVNLRRAPRKDAEILTVLDATATGRCYGTINGDALIKNGESLWYYVKFGDIRGYCYYAHVSVDETPPNIIEKEPDPPPVDEPADTEPVDDKPATPSTAIIILIVALCVPVPFIMFYLFRKPKNDD